jgi:hypothetical protein
MQIVRNVVFISLDTSVAGDFHEFRAAAVKSTADAIAVTKLREKKFRGNTTLEQLSGRTHLLNSEWVQHPNGRRNDTVRACR